MCFNAILSSHPTLAFSHRVQKSVLYICVFFVVLHCCHLSYFHIYALIYCIHVFLSDLLTLCNRLQFHPPHLNWFKCTLFNSWVIFHCVYVPQLSYPFICQWTSSYCKQSCDEHWGTHISFNSGFLSVYAQPWDCWVVWQFYFQFFKESSHWSP